jgi:hypothetical protein
VGEEGGGGERRVAGGRSCHCGLLAWGLLWLCGFVEGGVKSWGSSDSAVATTT